MKNRRQNIWVIFIFLGFLFLGQFRDTSDYSFYLSTTKIFSVSESPSIQVETYGYSGNIHFRAYKITNPIEYFENLRDPHNPDVNNLNASNVFKVIKSSAKKITRDLRIAARNMMPSETRKNITRLLDISQTKDTVAKRKISDIPKELVDYPIVLDWNESIQKSDEYWNYHTTKVNLNTPGVYLVEGKVPNSKVAYTVVVISDYAMITKNNDKNVVAFVSNKKSGNAVSDFPLSFYVNKKKIGDYPTEKNGLTKFEIPKVEKKIDETDLWDYESEKYLIMGYKNEHFVISEPYFYSYYASYNKFNVYTYTERPVYRPGQEVFFKAMIRGRGDNGGWNNYPEKFVKIMINDPRGNTIFNDSIKTNSNGTLNGKLKLESEATLGNYWMEFVVEGMNYSNSFDVQEYKKPEYKVDVSFNKEFYVKGDMIKADVGANYYFGSPVANANVEYFIYRSRYYTPWWEGSDDEWLYEGDDFGYEYHQELVESGIGKLDQEGKYSFSYYTSSTDKVDYTYRITANVTDESRRVISGSNRVKVMRGNFTITSRLDKYVYTKDDDILIKVIAEDFKKNPVMTNFQVKMNINSYDRIEKWENGVKKYEYKSNVKNITTLYGGTDKSGIGYINFKPKENGYFSMEVYARDSKGNEITYNDYIYVSDRDYVGYWGSEASGNIKIIPEKNSYTEGEVMRALVIAPASNLDVLVTAEREDIYSAQVEHFNGTSKVIEIPVKANYSPNIYLNVSTLFDDNYFNQTKKMIIPAKNKFLNVKIENDKDSYKPKENGKLTVKVTSTDGKPVKNTELSLGIVDESIYAISPETTPDIKKHFYSVRPNQVQSNSSLFFNFYGYSRNIRINEYADLYENNSRDKKLFAQSNERDRIAFGDIKGEEFVEPSVRKDFKDMILWVPTVTTNGNGIAEFDVSYPDNLTAWRATVRAINSESQVGNTTSKTITRKNLIIRLETPRFFIQKDQSTIAAVVHNYLNNDKSVKISLAGNNISVIGQEQTLKIPKNGQVRIDFKVNTENYFGDAKLTAKALTNEESDAIELTVPILTHGMSIAESQTLNLEGASESKLASFVIPGNTNLNSAKYYITMSPSLASSLLGSLDDLIGYPYGCVEQTMSKFLPTIIVSNALQDLGMPVSNKMKEEIPKMVEKGLNRLYNFQHSSDGGWGWWKDDQTDPFMTAYVVYGMSLAKRAKYEVDNSSLSKGMWNLKYWIDNKKDLDITTKAYLLYVLAFANEREKILENQIINNQLAACNKSDLNNYGKSLLALANYYQGNKNEAYALVDQVEKNATYEGSHVFWKGKSWHYNWQDDEVETTAYALKALISLKGDHQSIQKGINWLLSRRFGFSWESTKQTAMVVFALVDYLKNSKELKPDYLVKVYLNDKLINEKKMSKDDVFSKENRILIENSGLLNGENRIRVEKYGDGVLYFTSRILYFTGEENIQPKTSGFTVQRDYYKLILQKQGDKFGYIKQPLNGSIKSGELIFVKLKLNSLSPYEYFMLEDPIPSGCEVISNTNGYFISGEAGYDKTNYYSWNWWWAAKEIRDEKVTFFAKNIYAGDFNFSYIMRAQIPGDYHIMPSQATLMYYPEIRGNSNERYLNISE